MSLLLDAGFEVDPFDGLAWRPVNEAQSVSFHQDGGITGHPDDPRFGGHKLLIRMSKPAGSIARFRC